MPPSQSLTAYADVKEVLLLAGASGGGRYVLDTPGAAMHWRQRAYTYRKLYRERYPGDERFEQFVLRCEGPVVVIEPRKPTGTFKPAEGGTPVPLDAPATSALSPDDDGLLDEARALAKRLTGEGRE